MTPTSGLSVSTLWTEATPPLGVVALAHGAGADMRHPFMTGLAEGLSAGGFSVLRFNFPYMDAGRRIPDAPRVLLETWNAVLGEAVRRAGGLPVVAGGKSMGGRIASMLAAARGSEFPAIALAFFGYPLHPPGKPDRLRDAHLSQVRVPMLFVQGSNDTLARPDLIEALVKRLHPLAKLHLVDGGDHSFRRRGARSSDHVNARDVAQIASRHIRQMLERGPNARRSAAPED